MHKLSHRGDKEYFKILTTWLNTLRIGGARTLCSITTQIKVQWLLTFLLSNYLLKYLCCLPQPKTTKKLPQAVPSITQYNIPWISFCWKKLITYQWNYFKCCGNNSLSIETQGRRTRDYISFNNYNFDLTNIFKC